MNDDTLILLRKLQDEMISQDYFIREKIQEMEVERQSFQERLDKLEQEIEKYKEMISIIS